MESRFLFSYIIACLSGIITGLLISAYDDRLLQLKHKIFSKKTVLITAVNSVIWIILVHTYGVSTLFLLYALTSTLLVGLSVIDIAIFEIPVQFNVLILVIGSLGTALDYRNWPEHIIGMFLVSGVFLLIALVTKGKGMGGGDIKLMATVGLLIGWKQILLVMALGSILGAVIHSIVMATTKKEHVLAFGPYLSAASVIAMCWGDKIINTYIMFLMRTKVG